MQRVRYVRMFVVVHAAFVMGVQPAVSDGSGPERGSEPPVATQIIHLDRAAPAGVLPDAELVRSLTAWVADQTGLPQPASPPRFAFASAAVMAAMSIGEGSSGGWLHSTDRSDRIEAMYDTRRRMIFLPHSWRPEPVNLSALVHELVHHMQTEEGRIYACAEAREAPAYAAQIEWLKRFGLTLEDSYGIDGLTLLVRTNCGM